jgi:hypothetical protein
MLVQFGEPVRVLELCAEHPVTPEQIQVRADQGRYRGWEQPDVYGEKA